MFAVHFPALAEENSTRKLLSFDFGPGSSLSLHSIEHQVQVPGPPEPLTDVHSGGGKKVAEFGM